MLRILSQWSGRRRRPDPLLRASVAPECDTELGIIAERLAVAEWGRPPATLRPRESDPFRPPLRWTA
jgi:hypothetical protein